MSRKEIRNLIENFLTVEAKEQWDYHWTQEFRSWDKGDCSEMGLMMCYVRYLLENCDYYEKSDWEEILKDSLDNCVGVLERV